MIKQNFPSLNSHRIIDFTGSVWKHTSTSQQNTEQFLLHKFACIAHTVIKCIIYRAHLHVYYASGGYIL